MVSKNIKAAWRKIQDGRCKEKEKMIDWFKFKLTQILNIVTGKDKNWDGSVDIKDKLIEAEQKVKNGS